MTLTRTALCLATIAIVGSLEGCQTYRPPPPTPGQLAQQQRRPPPRPARPPAARTTQEPPAEATGVDTPPGPAAEPDAPAAAPPPLTGAAPPPGSGQTAALPQRITGLRAEEVRQRLGAPESQRTAGAARVWRYRGRECTVDIYFYYDTGQADFFALEQRLEGQAPSPEACLGTIPAATRPG